MQHLSIDIETFSDVDIKKAGLYKYAQSSVFEVLLFAWSLNGSPVYIVDFTSGERLPEWMLDALRDTDVTKHAFNAAFEWYCLSKHFGQPLPLDQWQDTQLHSLYCGYSGGLGAAGIAIGLPSDKRKITTGKALIKTFCVPRIPTVRDQRTRVSPVDEPQKWQLFKEYCRQDVYTEMALEQRLSSWPVPSEVQKQWVTDITINARGVAVDTELVQGALHCSVEITESLTSEATALSGLSNPNSVGKLSKWIEEETGVEIEGLTKNVVSDLLSSALQSDPARRMLEIRQELGKTSVAKYSAMNTAVCADGRLRGMLQFYGANRTGRWAGRIIQPQNLPRTYLQGTTLDNARQWVREGKTNYLDKLVGSVPGTLSQLIRTALIPASGKHFVDADFSAIEARVIAWLAGEEWVLDVFRTHGKIYEACASQMFGVPLDKIVKGCPEYNLRQRGKVATLALGYQGGVGALIAMGALRDGIPEDDLPDIVRRWRLANKRIVDLWWSIENAAVDTVKTCRVNNIRGLQFAITANENLSFLLIKLPSGRELYYPQPHIGENRFGRPALQYMGQNQTNKQWGSVDTYGGKLTENIIQAIARDCLAESITRLENSGYPVVFHVHDEVIIEMENPDLASVCKIMAEPIPWARGLPLDAAGWVGGYYTKD